MTRAAGVAVLSRGPRPLRPLTPAEQKIIDLVCEGHCNESIGNQLSISEETVKRHLSNIFPKLCVTSRTELAVKVLNRRHAAALDGIRRAYDPIYGLQNPAILTCFPPAQ